MKPSKYLERFKQDGLDKLIQIPADGLLVERIPPEERRTQSGLILPVDVEFKQINSLQRDVPTFVHVIAVGAGYYNDETKESVPLDSKPGQILLIGITSAKWFSDFLGIKDYSPFDIGFMRESEANIRIFGLDEYHSLSNKLSIEVPKDG
jgi:co-chaperonin GroES (HSP10)